jgi:hypothetical protein
MIKMNSESSCEIYQGFEVPESVLLRREQVNKYGSVPGLDDSELADPNELERQVYLEEFGPVLALPVKGRDGIRPDIDEDGSIDWGAFGSVDFDRYCGGFDRVRYKADKLREHMKDVLIIASIVKSRLPVKAAYLVLKYIKLGLIGLDDVVNNDMLALARLYLRIERLRGEIRQLERASEARSRRQMTRLFGA